MLDSKKKYIWSLVTAFLMLFTISLGMMFYSSYIKNKLTLTIDKTLEEIISQQAFNFASKLEEEKKALATIAATIAVSNNLSDIRQKNLNDIKKKTSFEYLAVIDKSGNAINNNEVIKTNLSNKTYFQQAIKGENCISEPIHLTSCDKTILVLATPIIYDGKIIGVLTGSYKAEELDKLFLSSFGESGYAYVTTNQGKIIAKTTNSNSLTNSYNIFDTYKNAEFFYGDNFETIKQKVAQNESGCSRYKYDGQERIMHYRAININGWNIFSIVPAALVSKNANEITFATTILSFIYIAVFLFLIVWNFRIQRESYRKISDIAFLDDLTNAPTLSKFRIDAQNIIENNPNKCFLFVKLDVDNFKLINRMYGYTVGDRLLICMKDAIETLLNGQLGTFARLNSDEFILMHEFFIKDQLKANRKSFVNILNEAMGEGFNHKLLIPTGRYILSPDSKERDVTTAIEKANFAHRQAKLNKVEIYDYDEKVTLKLLMEKELENKMESALIENQFRLYLQPKYYLKDETIAGAEALVRWVDDKDEIIYPGKFIPLFEENGFIAKLDIYMYEMVCQIIRKWLDNDIDPVVVSVNFSRNHLSDKNFVETLCNLADKYNVPKHYLELELTESTIFHNEHILIQVLEDLHAAGFTLSMDDFGTGYSSLGLLKNIPVDVLKIDRSFFSISQDELRAKTVISNVIKMARELGIMTVAEGVETKEHISLLKELGCDIVQGFYYVRPMPEKDFTSQILSKIKG